MFICIQNIDDRFKALALFTWPTSTYVMIMNYIYVYSTKQTINKRGEGRNNIRSENEGNPFSLSF